MPTAVLIPILISAGGMALQYLLSPRVKQTPTDKGRMDDIRITGSGYGTIIRRTWGRTRGGGDIVVQTGVDTYVISTPGGGKKSGQGPVNEYTYTTSLAVIVQRGVLESFLRIWADSDLFINNDLSSLPGTFEADLATLTGGASSYADVTASDDIAVQHLGNGGKVEFDISSVVAPAQPPTDPNEVADPKTRIFFYYKCATNLNATIETDVSSPETVAFGASAEWTVKSVLIPDFADTVSYENAAAAAPNLDFIRASKYWLVHIDQNQVTGIIDPTIAYPPDLDDPSGYYDYPAASAKDGGTGTYSMELSAPAQQVRLYTGTETQTQDPKIVAWLDGRYGAGEGDLRASAMRGIAYMLVQDLTLKSNAPPNFTFETDTGDNNVNTILEDLFTDVGLEAADYLITATSALEQIGFVEHQSTSRKSLIESLERYHGFRLAEIDGKITTVLDTFTSVATISANDLRAHSDTEEMPRFDAEIAIKEPHLLPREVRVSVMQPALDYHNESVVAQLFTDIAGKESKEYSFPIVDPANLARLSAEKLILKEYSEDQAYQVEGMPATAKWSIGDVVTFPINGTERKMRVEKRQMVLPIGKVTFQCVSVNPFTPTYYQSDVTLTASRALEQFPRESFPRNSVVFVIQSDPIRDHDKGRLGVYLAVCCRGRGDGTSSILYRETAEDNFEIQQKIAAPSILGLCEDTLATHGGGTLTEDTTNVLDIWFFDDIDLETVTQPDIDRNPLVNLMRVGDEWVQFRTAAAQTLEDDSPYKVKWRISNLWRGKFGTASAISTHSASEYAALATPTLFFYDLEPADVGKEVTLKAVTNGQGVDLAPLTTFTFAGNNDTGELVPIFDHFTDATTTGTTQQTLYIDQIDAGLLSVNGDKITAEYSGIFANNVNEKIIIISFAGADLFASSDFGAITDNGLHWNLEFALTRVSNTVVRCSTELFTGSGLSFVHYTEVTGLDLTTTDYDLLFDGFTPSLAGDLTAKMAYGLFIPAAVTNTGYLLDESGDVLQDEGGDELSEG